MEKGQGTGCFWRKGPGNCWSCSFSTVLETEAQGVSKLAAGWLGLDPGWSLSIHWSILYPLLCLPRGGGAAGEGTGDQGSRDTVLSLQLQSPKLGPGEGVAEERGPDFMQAENSGEAGREVGG